MVVSIFYFLQRFNNPPTPRRYSHETRSNQNIHGPGQHPGRNDYLHVKKQQHPFLQKKDLGNGGIMGIYGGSSKAGADIYVADTDAEAAAEILEGMGLINS